VLFTTSTDLPAISFAVTTSFDSANSPVSPKRKRDSICTNDGDDESGGGNTGLQLSGTLGNKQDQFGGGENTAVQPTTPTRLLTRLRQRSPFRRTVSLRRASSSRLVTSTTTESRDGDDDNDDDEQQQFISPTKRSRRELQLTGFAIKKNRGRLLASSQKRFFRLAGAQLSFAADEVILVFFFFFFFSNEFLTVTKKKSTVKRGVEECEFAHIFNQRVDK
jgi:hypothetical protein